MNYKTRLLLKEILSKVKSPATGSKEFKDETEVIEHAIQVFHTQLKQKRLI